MTMNVYGRTRSDRLSEIVEDVARGIELEQKCVLDVYQQAVGPERESATPLSNRELHSFKMAAAGIEPGGAKPAHPTPTPTPHTSANSLQDNTLALSPTAGNPQNSTHPIHGNNKL